MPKRNLLETLRKMDSIHRKNTERYYRRDYLEALAYQNEETQKYDMLGKARTESDNLRHRLENQLYAICDKPGIYLYSCLDAIAGDPLTGLYGSSLDRRLKADKYLEDLQNSVEMDPLMYVDHKLPVIRNYARKLINGD